MYHFKIHGKNSPAKSWVRITFLEYWLSNLFHFLYTVVLPYIKIKSEQSTAVINYKYTEGSLVMS